MRNENLFYTFVCTQNMFCSSEEVVCLIARLNSSIIMALAATNNKTGGLERDMQSLWLCFRSKQLFCFFCFTNSQCLHFSLNFCTFYMRFNGNNQHERRVTVSGSINNWIWILMRESNIMKVGKIQDPKKTIDTVAAVTEPAGFLIMKNLLKWITALPQPSPSSPAMPVHKILQIVVLSQLDFVCRYKFSSLLKSAGSF